MNHTDFMVLNITLQFDDNLDRPSHLREDKLDPTRSIWNGVYKYKDVNSFMDLLKVKQT